MCETMTELSQSDSPTQSQPWRPGDSAQQLAGESHSGAVARPLDLATARRLAIAGGFVFEGASSDTPDAQRANLAGERPTVSVACMRRLAAGQLNQHLCER